MQSGCLRKAISRWPYLNEHFSGSSKGTPMPESQHPMSWRRLGPVLMHYWGYGNAAVDWQETAPDVSGGPSQNCGCCPRWAKIKRHKECPRKKRNVSAAARLRLTWQGQGRRTRGRAPDFLLDSDCRMAPSNSGVKSIWSSTKSSSQSRTCRNSAGDNLRNSRYNNTGGRDHDGEEVASGQQSLIAPGGKPRFLGLAGAPSRKQQCRAGVTIDTFRTRNLCQ
jgi:hypothetical protein